MVCLPGGVVVGFVDALPGEVTRLFILPEVAGVGLGRRLLEIGIAQKCTTSSPCYQLQTRQPLVDIREESLKTSLRSSHEQRFFPMKRPQTAPLVRALLSFQNRIRGAVGSSRSRSFDKNSKDTALRNRIRISRIIAESRTALSIADYEFFLEWAGSYTRSQAPSIEQARYQFDELGNYSSKSPLKLELEITAACTRLARNLEPIREFRKFANEIEDAFWQTDSNKIKRHLAAVEETFGQSIWLIEANIAFRQIFEGLESQKQYAQAIRSKTRSGIAPYCLSFATRSQA